MVSVIVFFEPIIYVYRSRGKKYCSSDHSVFIIGITPKKLARPTNT